MESIATWFSERSFMPHGHCYLWSPALVWTQLVTNLVIGASYLIISALLALFVARVRGLPFRLLYVAFGVFIVTCGMTHFMDALVIWYPRYWLDALLRAATALASLGTALLLPRLLPKAIRVAHRAQRIRERGGALESALADLESMYRASIEIDQLKTRFFANVSHELRTPLTLILGPTESLLQDARITGEQRRELDMIARNTRTLLRHVNNLLDIAKLDASQLEPHYSEADLAELVRFTTASFDSLARERAVTLSVIAPEALPAQIDVEKLQRVLLNLLSNAFKFTPREGVVRVELAPCAPDASGRHSVRLTVADSGPGIAVEDRELVFERFRQARELAPGRQGGTGLGLSIVREFVHLHGGSVQVCSAPEGGAQFDVELPVAAPAGARVHRDAELSSASPRAFVQELRGSAPAADDPVDLDDAPLVLLVEDNPDMRQLISKCLRGRYRLAHAADGREGLEKARELRPDLIVSDMMMPEMDGEALVRAVRQHEALNAVPILLLTAKSDEELRTRTLESGAQDYVLKPFSSEELIARIHNLLTIKRTRDLLQSEVDAQQHDVETLSRQVVAQKHELSAALSSAREARLLAEQASRAKSDFLSLVSHELRTPLTSIQLQLERLRRGVTGVVSTDQVHAVDTIARSSVRLLDLLEALLEFGRIESGRLEVNRGTVDLASLVREVVDDLRPRAEQKGLSLDLDLSHDLPYVETDARLVRLIVVNLVDNAIKYTESGAVTVELARSHASGLRLRVADTGPGIEPSLQQLIFEPFQQLEHVRHKRGSGVGLGLALVKSIAQVLHADVLLESEVGRGSTFTVTLAA